MWSESRGKPMRLLLAVSIAAPIAVPAWACPYSERPPTAEELGAVAERDRQERLDADVIDVILMAAPAPFLTTLYVPLRDWKPEFASEAPVQFASDAGPVRRGYSYQQGRGTCQWYSFFRPNVVDWEKLRSGVFVRKTNYSENLPQPKGYHLNRANGYFVERSDRGRPAARYFVVLSLRPCKSVPDEKGDCR
ncbi:hypothetical protein B2G71_02985 [Novosphingobium sp. PC22D]|uniref:hypothetical protein n=1 Tax=Novosphingobium sp. PC22D TaxID=1962403 RepID=UPI000BEFBCC2|nr:hypothetical protein [Novosphingobium sp. PC22D]PEQ14556.1 hypothetical protein B2G71_02985 [Novosphingobium sp. PC22D]